MSTKIKTKEKEEVKSSEIVILDVYAINKKELQSLVDGYKNLIVTEENLKDGKAALQVLRQKRYDIQNQQKANDKMRIEWNSKYMNSNKAKAEEYISLISPVEDPIAEQVKRIEDIVQIEKERIANEKRLALEAKTKRIIDTGAIMVDGGYELGNTFIAIDEISFLQDEAFDIVVSGFEKVAKKMADEKEAAEKQEQLKAERIKTRIARLFEVGMLGGAWGFILPAEIGATVNITDEMISECDDKEFESKVNNVIQLVSNRKKELLLEQQANQKVEAERKAEADRIDLENKKVAEQNRIESELLQKEKDAIAEQKKALDDEKIKAEAEKKEAEEKKRMEEEAVAEKKRLEQEAIVANQKEQERVKALLPDKEKLVEFANTFNKPFVVELKTEEGNKLLSDFNLAVIEAVQTMVIKLNKLN